MAEVLKLIFLALLFTIGVSLIWEALHVVHGGSELLTRNQVATDNQIRICFFVGGIVALELFVLMVV